MKNDSPPGPDSQWDVVRATPQYQPSYISLCASCRHNTDCMFQKDRRSLSFYCEEFEIDPGPVATISPVETMPLPALQESDGESFIGLCSNCDNRRTCDFPKPEGGIWHCEEYL